MSVNVVQSGKLIGAMMDGYGYFEIPRLIVWSNRCNLADIWLVLVLYKLLPIPDNINLNKRKRKIRSFLPQFII